MADGLTWSAAQWERVNREVTEAFEKANVVGKFLPRYGPLADSAEYIKEETLLYAEDPNAAPYSPTSELSVSDDTTLKLFNLTVHVRLSREQVFEESLSAALLAFRRAGNMIAQAEDAFVLKGHGPASSTPWLEALNQNRDNQDKQGIADPPLAVVQFQSSNNRGADEELVRAIVTATTHLENQYHPGPFACVLSNQLYNVAYTPVTKSMVLPADRIVPLLAGMGGIGSVPAGAEPRLFQCGRIDDPMGVVVSLAGGDIDLVVATPIRVEFLQIDIRSKYVFRVYEKFIWRMKDPRAVVLLNWTNAPLFRVAVQPPANPPQPPRRARAAANSQSQVIPLVDTDVTIAMERPRTRRRAKPRGKSKAGSGSKRTRRGQ